MKLLFLLALIACACGAQTFTTTLVGSEIDCFAVPCAGPMDNGDTLNFSAWDLTGSFTFNGVSGTGSVYGTYNDGANLTCSAHSPPGGNISWLRMSVLDLITPGNTTFSSKNCMTDFQNGGAPQWPPAADGTCTVGVVSNCSWKSQGVLSVDGKTYLQVFRQDGGPSYSGHDSTLVMTVDGGVNWTNPAHVGVSTSANGDAPAGPGDATYPASIIWPDPSPFDGSTQYMARMQFVMYCRDNTVGCPSVDNNSTYVYALAYDGQFANYRLARGLRSTLATLAASSWSYYKCPGYDPVTHVCDGTLSGSWDTNMLNATVLFATNAHGVLGGLIYSADLGAYVFIGSTGTTCCNVFVSTAPHVWGPYTASATLVVTAGWNFAMPIISSLTTVTPNSKVRLTLSSTGYTHNVSGTLFLNTIEMTKITAAVDGSRMSSPTQMGSKVLFSSTGSGALTINVVSKSNTQAILSYTAPSTAACSVEVSESPTYLPVVNDVDSSLFTGAALDNRDGNLGAGTTSRMILVGRRATTLALDSKNYSRALQANTTHYVRVGCGGNIGTTSFTTNNIPGGNTYPEIPAVVTPGTPFLPTVSTSDRTQTIIDQYTGAKMKAVTIYSDRNGSGSILGFDMEEGGFVRIFSPAQQTTSDGKVGFVAAVHNTGNSASNIYFIETSTGYVRALGWANPSDNPVKLDANLCYISNRNSSTATRYCYNGAWVEQPNTNAFDGGTVVSTVGLDTQLLAFDATYDSSLFPNTAAPFANAFSYNLFTANRSPNGQQDSYGWNVVYYGGDGRLYNPSCTPVTAGGNCPGIIAAFLSMNNPKTKYCGNHNTQLMPNVPTNPTVPMQILSWHGLMNNGAISTGEWGSTITVQLNPGGTSATISAVPTNRSGTDAFNPGNWAIGDIIGFHIVGPVDDAVTVTGISGSGPYVVSFTPAIAGGHTYPIGTQVTELCNAKNLSGNAQNWEITYWKFLSDPHFTDTTNSTVVLDQYFEDGHYDNGLNGRMGEAPAGWQVVTGDISTNLDIAIPLEIADSPTFHGVGGQCFSGSCTKHPSCHVSTLGSATEQTVCDDMTPVSGGGQFYGGSNNPVGSPVTGTLYIYPGAIDPPYNAAYSATDTLRRKVVPTFAYTGSTPYQDVSGPTSLIGGTSADNWKYCVVYKAGECFSMSTVGQIYFNPGVTLTFPYCTDSDSPQPTAKNICIGMMPAYGQTIPQLLTSAANPTAAARRNRVLTHGLVGLGQAGFNFPTAKQTPDGSWSFFYAGKGNPACAENSSDFCNIWAVKVPPFPAQDAYDRSDFIPISTGTITGGGSVTNAIVKFGYLEFGLSTDFYCTSRAESCFANNATIPVGANPFSYPVDGSSNTLATLTGVSCSSTCTINIPALSGHTLYYQIITRDSGNGILSTGATQVVIVP